MTVASAVALVLTLAVPLTLALAVPPALALAVPLTLSPGLGRDPSRSALTHPMIMVVRWGRGTPYPP